MNWCLGIERLGLLAISPGHSVTGNPDTSLCLVKIGRPSQMTSGAMSLDYNIGGEHPRLVRLSSFFFFFIYLFIYF